MTEISRYKKHKATYQAYDRKNKERNHKLQRDWRLRQHPDYAKNSSRRHRLGNQEYYNEYNRRWRKNNPEKKRAGNLISKHIEKYPLADSCEFCGTRERLEHGHIDYDYPELYLTVCHRCNCWMDKGKVKTK